MVKFDLDKFIEEYKKNYDSLPDKSSGGYGPIKKPSKETVSDDNKLRKQIEAVLKDNVDNSACTTCPLNGKCRRINWKGDTTWVKVTGCSQHPDQKKFKGHSTTTVITDSTVAAATQNNNATSYALCRSAAVASEGTFTDTLAAYIHHVAAGSIYIIARGHLYFDCTAIPSDAIVSASKFSLYISAIYNDNGNADNMNIVKGNTAPNSPVVAADYANSKYDYSTTSATVHRGDLVDDNYNDWNLSSPFGILVKAGYTLGMLVYSDDQAGNAPAADDTTYGANPNGSTGENPPKLSITYDLPIVISRSLNKKQMVI